MNINLIRSVFCILLTLPTYQYSFAETSKELARINIRLSGEVTTSTCGVLKTDADKYINLGHYSVKSLNSIGKTTDNVPITLNLTNCLANSSVTITFTGTQDINNQNLLALNNSGNSASNVAIEILNPDQTRLQLNKKSQSLTADQSGNITTTFYARYAVTKLPVSAGTANAAAQFTVQYD